MQNDKIDVGSNVVQVSSASVGVEVTPISKDLIDELVANPNWAQIDPQLHDLLMALPRVAYEIERTTILTWMYQDNGVMAFEDLVLMIEKGDLKQRRRNLRQVLRNLVDLQLISYVNFEAPDRRRLSKEQEDSVGLNSMLSLEWAGMVWLRRAWIARQRLMRSSSFMSVHQLLVEEEDDGKKNSPAWVENICQLTEIAGYQTHTPRLTMRSVFDLAGGI